MGVETKRKAKAELAQGFAAKAAFGGPTGSQKRLPPPPYCRSVFATIAQNRTAFLLFAVYKQVTQTQNQRNLILALIIHDSQTPFSTTLGSARNYPSEKNLNIPRNV